MRLKKVFSSALQHGLICLLPLLGLHPLIPDKAQSSQNPDYLHTITSSYCVALLNNTAVVPAIADSKPERSAQTRKTSCLHKKTFAGRAAPCLLQTHSVPNRILPPAIAIHPPYYAQAPPL